MSCQCKADHKIIFDERALNFMLKIEKNYVINENYFKKFEDKIKPSMRTELATWMLEVCEDSGCTDEVYGLAINLFDRLLNEMDRVDVYHLQLFGAVCLFIAAKLKSSGELKLNATKLIEYSDNAFNLEDLLEWELFVLDKLKWDVSSVVPNDFVDFFLHRIKIDVNIDLLRRHSLAFTALCSSEFKFSKYLASQIAAASILTAIKGLNNGNNQIGNQFSKIASINLEILYNLESEITEYFNRSAGIETNKSTTDDEKFIDLQFEFNPVLSESNSSYDSITSSKSMHTPPGYMTKNIISPSPKKIDSRSSSSSSSGVSSVDGHNYLRHISPSYFSRASFSPPSANLLPMPRFKSDNYQCCNSYDHSAGCFSSLSKSTQKSAHKMSNSKSASKRCSRPRGIGASKQLLIF